MIYIILYIYEQPLRNKLCIKEAYFQNSEPLTSSSTGIKVNINLFYILYNLFWILWKQITILFWTLLRQSYIAVYFYDRPQQFLKQFCPLLQFRFQVTHIYLQGIYLCIYIVVGIVIASFGDIGSSVKRMLTTATSDH